MKNRVLYVSKGKSENAKKVADAVAGSARLSADPVEEHTAISDLNILFAGCEVNSSGKIDGTLRKLLQKADPSQVKLVAVFSTSASGTGSALAEVKSILEPKGIKVSDTEFFCKGASAFGNKGCPTEDDLNKAKAFAAKIIADAQKA
ncbi:MAG: flavodoxin [Clostridiales bacterium]|jgi:hypothetical protein|nr:flavodoxin [Clostridiales bacterium]